MDHVTLNNGVEMPQLGFGVWQIPDDQAYEAVSTALEAGYRSIDTAAIYGNEKGVGRAVGDSGINRDELFITTKLWNRNQGFDETLEAFDRSLARLGLDTVDLYLIHWPMPDNNTYVPSWQAMERLYGEGRTKAIGVSNFTAPTLDRLVKETDVVPVLNQIELHPYLNQREMRAANAGHGLLTEAWSPLGQGQGLLDDPVLVEVGTAFGKTPAQVVLRWHLQTGNVVIPKSATPARIVENLDVFDFTLDAEAIARINDLDRNGRIGPDPATMHFMG